MTTATAKELEVDVQFGGVSIGDETARVGIKIDRGRMSVEEADEFLCGKRLTGRIEVCAPGEQQGQQSLPGMKDTRPHLDGTFDVKRFGVSLKEISAGLTFSIASIEVSELAKFAKKNGRLTITAAEFLPDDDDDDSDPDLTVDDHEDVGPMARRKRKAPVNGVVPGDAGAAKSIFELVKFGVSKKKLEAVAESAGGSTIGHLEKFMREDEWWHKKAKGLGEVWVTRITDALWNFRKQHPVPTEEDAAPTIFDGKQERPAYTGPSEDIKEAYLAGCEACNEGGSADDNPHPAGSALHTAWSNGFNEMAKA